MANPQKQPESSNNAGYVFNLAALVIIGILVIFMARHENNATTHLLPLQLDEANENIRGVPVIKNSLLRLEELEKKVEETSNISHKVQSLERTILQQNLMINYLIDHQASENEKTRDEIQMELKDLEFIKRHSTTHLWRDDQTTPKPCNQKTCPPQANGNLLFLSY